MKKRSLKDLLELEHNTAFTGWDFSHISGRMQDDVLPWNYKKLIEDALPGKESMLDIDTGGGEFLDSFQWLPKKTFATEAYEPNIPIAKERLNRRGIIVDGLLKEVPLPYESSFFDLVICRHGSFSQKDLLRIMKPNGLFITQQVGSLNAIDLNASLGDITRPIDDWCLARAMLDLEGIGFHIELYKENIGKYRFYDIGSVVYYLKCIPWQIPDFSIEKYFSRLETINRIIERNDYIDFISHRFILRARKNFCVSGHLAGNCRATRTDDH